MLESVARMLDRPVRARTDGGGRQVVEVTVRHGYHPEAIAARAGMPLRIVFRRDDEDACAERVVFSEPRLVRHLARGITTVDLPAHPPGVVRFTCGMGRYRGRIELAARPPAGARAPGGQTRRRWIVMGALGAGVVAVLVASGVLSPTLALAGGLLAACGLLHLVGHGAAHGGAGRGD
jgi:hypothetical protein